MITIGMNSRLDKIQAIILNEKLKKLNLLNAKRKIIAKRYNDKFKMKKLEKLIILIVEGISSICNS